MNLLFVFALFYLSSEASSKTIFKNGRRVGGNLGEPNRDQKSVRAFPDEWFTQKLDHFNPSDARTWQQRYFSNEQFWDSKGPVFVMIGGESEASPAWLAGGSWISDARKHGALLFQVEHRFYGRSRPTEDLSLESLRYLTSEQALADLATFIDGMNRKYNLTSDVQWVAFGGSYAGSLAAWLRFKYPHLVHAAVDSSGPLLAQVDFPEYYGIVRESLAKHSEQCPQTIQEAVDQIGTLLGDSSGQENVNQLFKLCDNIQDSVDNKLDIENFYSIIAGYFAGVVQYNVDNTNTMNIDYVCDVMTNETIGTPLERLSELNIEFLESYGEECLDFKYDSWINYMKNSSWDSDGAGGWRQWFYQTCTEFGYYQTSSQEPQIFGDQFPVSFYYQQCLDMYSEAFDSDFVDAAIDHTNIMYGGLDIEVTNVVHVHGSVDPWHALGITETLNEGDPAILIEGASHCANMYTPTSIDPPQMVEARKQISGFIDQWLSQRV